MKKTSRKRYWVYEKDTFMSSAFGSTPEITPKKAFFLRSSALIDKKKMENKMSHLRQYLSYHILKCEKGESFKEAYEKLGERGEINEV